MTGWVDDVYFKKRINYALLGQPFAFDVAELLFSSHEVDTGSQFLLRKLLATELNPRSILDLGCGYGVLGIVLASRFPDARVVLSDKDLLAVHYTEHNILLNGNTNARVFGSIGIDHLPPAEYDLIVSNIPGHIGDVAIEHDFLLRPLERLVRGGTYAFVVVNPLRELVEDVAQRHELALEMLGDRTAHAVYRIVK